MTRTVVALALLPWAALTATWIVSENASPVTSIKNQRDQVLNEQAPGIRVGYIGDSILRGNNLAASDGLLITAQANREITWPRARDGWRAPNYNTTHMEWESNAPTTDELMHGVVSDSELDTMPLKLPDIPSRIAPVLRIYLHADTATGSGVMQIKQFEFFEVESPLPARNADRVGQNQVPKIDGYGYSGRCLRLLSIDN
jgi:hypothetical protein